MAAGMTKIITGFNFNSHTIGSDVALFVPGSNTADFSDPTKIVDFMQYGSAGNPTESVAVTKGYWDTGDFVLGAPGFSFTGTKNDHGVQFWNGTSSIDEVTKEASFYIYPVPATNILTIEMAKGTKLVSYQLISSAGKVIIDVKDVNFSNSTKVDISTLPKGFYLLVLNDKNKSSLQQIIIQ